MDDLDEIKKEIELRKQQSTPIINFDKKNVENEMPTTAQDKASELVENAFNQAIVHRVATDEAVQEELLDSANTVIHNKMNALKAKADQEEKEAYFNNRRNACDCFGYNEATTEKWAVNLMNLWHNLFTAIWLFIGGFTFAPITFVAKKITVIFKKSWVAITLAIVIYLAAVGAPILLGFLNK